MLSLSAVLLTFSFPFSLLFFHIESQAAAAAYVVYTISDIELTKNVGSTSLYAAYIPGENFELILTVKM